MPHAIVDASMAFFSHFTETMEALAPTAEPHVIGRIRRGLVNAYHRNRYYHDIRHPVSMIDEVLRLQPQYSGFAVDISALSCMIFWHDAIMKIGRPHGWNEQESAKLAWRDLEELGLDTPFMHLVVIGIRASANHLVPLHAVQDEVGRNTISLFLDLDLSGLSSRQSVFSENTEQIWFEYEPMLERSEYDTGRKAWAAKFLERPHIYHTPLFTEREAAARKNLERLADD